MISGAYNRTDRQTDRQTDSLAVYRSADFCVLEKSKAIRNRRMALLFICPVKEKGGKA